MKSIKVYHYAISYNDCSISAYRSFTTIYHKCLIFLLKLNFAISYYAGIMLNTFMTHYAQNYVEIIGESLVV